MLITSCPVDIHTKESIWRIIEIYLTRWKCDESFRYIKQRYNLEDIRVRHYTSIRNMIAIILAVAYFASVYLGDNLKLKILIQRVYLVSKRFFGVPTFSNYAIADGRDGQVFSDNLQHILSGSPLPFIPLPLPWACCPSRPRQGSCRQVPDGAAVCCIDQKTVRAPFVHV